MIPFKDNIATETTPFVTLALIVANVVLYLIAVAHGGSVFSGPDSVQLANYGLIPNALTWDRVFTAMFMQASIVQLLGNMLFLWWFGNTIEDAMGAIRFFGFYIIGGVCAAGLQVAIDPNATATTVGAAGAIAGVLGGYFVLYRQARVLTLSLIPLFITVVEVPAVVLLALWFAMQAAFSAAGLTEWAAFIAQIGTFLLGALTVGLLASNRRPIPPTRVI